jgi:CBS domain-containing protein
MSVLELCDREIAAVGLEASVADAIHKMLDHHVGAVAVVDDEYRVAGIFTERDVLRKMALSHVDPRTTSVRDLMTTPVEMATRGTGAGEALGIMLERHFRHLPVADGFSPFETCWSGAWTTSLTNWTRSNSTFPTTDPGARAAALFTRSDRNAFAVLNRCSFIPNGPYFRPVEDDCVCAHRDLSLLSFFR